MLKTYSGLDRSIYFLFVAQVVNSVGHFVHPFLTLLLTLLAFLFIHVLLSLVYSQSLFSLPLQCSALFGERGPASFGALASLNGLAVIALTTLVLHFTRRLAPVLTVSLSGLFYAVGFGLIGLVGSMPWLLLSTLIWTVGEIPGGHQHRRLLIWPWTFALSLAAALLLALLYWRERHYERQLTGRGGRAGSEPAS